jgi:hypothetical protein
MPEVKAAEFWRGIDPFQARSASPPVTLELTILMPCLNEARTLPVCIQKANSYLARSGVVGEVLIADNGSTDGSREIALAHGARVVEVVEKGYGNALMGGIRAAYGRFVIMADSDDSYDFAKLDAFVAQLREGWQLVMGNRFAGGILPGAMPPLHRYLGNPFLTAIGRVLFRSPCGDFHCGLRGFDRDAVLQLGLQASGMEFASEMVVKATVGKLRITEVPTTLSPDGRGRPPHLKSWRDGWRHLRFLLLFSPRGLFLYPGAAMFGLGTFVMAILLAGPTAIGSAVFDIHTMLYAATAVLVGWQSIIFWACAKVHGMREGIVPEDTGFQALLRALSLERLLLSSLLLLLLGLGLGTYAVGEWGESGFRSLDPSQTMRLVIPSITAVLLATQTAYGAAFLEVLRIRRR